VIRTDLAALIRKHPKVLELLHDHGIYFCAGCYLTLSSKPERAAAYHGVPNVQKFMLQLDRIVRNKPMLHRSRRP